MGRLFNVCGALPACMHVATPLTWLVPDETRDSLGLELQTAEGPTLVLGIKPGSSARAANALDP